MQSAKDTFYVTLQDRLAGLNPARTIAIRGVTRPGVLVSENELVTMNEPADTFCLRWTGLKMVARELLPLVAMQCEVHYCTAGSAASSGTDRGRSLAKMDAELLTAVCAAPQNVLKTDYANAGGTAMGTRVFWGDVVFGAALMASERLTRVATIEVFAYQEAGEL